MNTEQQLQAAFKHKNYKELKRWGYRGYFSVGYANSRQLSLETVALYGQLVPSRPETGESAQGP